MAIADNSSLGSASVAVGPFYWDDQTSIQNQYLYSIRMKFLSKGTGAMPVYAANWGGTGTITVSGSTINSVTIDWTKWSDDTTYNIPLFKITPDTSDVGNIVEFKLDGTDPRVTDINPDFVRNGYIYIPEGWYVGVGDHSYNKTSGQVSVTGTFGHGGSSSISGHKFYYSNSDSSQEPTTVPSGFQRSGVWLGVQWHIGIIGQETVTTYNFDNYLATKEEVKTSELAANLIGNDTYNASAIKGIWVFNDNTHAALNGNVLNGVSFYPTGAYTVEFVKATVSSNNPMTTGANADVAAMRAGTDIPSQYVLFRITPSDLEVGQPTYFALDGSDPRVEIVNTDAYDAEQGGFPWNSTMALGISDWHNPETSSTTNSTSCFKFKSSGVSSSEFRSGFYGTSDSGTLSFSTASGSLFVNMYTTKTEVQTTIHSDIIKELMEKEADSPLKGKTVSFVGDSITTFKGITNVDPLPTNAATWYPHNSITSVDQTYWRKLVDRTGMNLLVNNAWSGSHVTNRGRGDICNYDYQADSGSGTSTNKDRCTHLHATQNGTILNPDYIVINMGTNDFDNMSATYPFGTWNGRGEDFPECSAKPTNFREAYAVMLRRITTAYPLAKVYCCTVPCGNVKGSGLNEKNAVGVYLVEFNDAIREIATAYGCRVIELATSGLNYNTLSTLYEDSNLHPNEAGMERYYEIIRAALEDDDSTNVSCPRYSALLHGEATAVADATDTSDVVAQFNALLAALRARGVIAAS